ncbi:hypothetical protein ACLB2K_057227 [Fragaria x ananassa]
MSSRSSRTIYVGNLPGDIRMREIEDLFIKYGPIVDIDLKIPPRPPGYAFIEFEDPRDADDAIYGRDGYNFDGYRLRVELAHGRCGYSSSDRFSNYSRSSSSRGAPRRSEYRVLVTGLPASASWQDLKDHMRQAGDVCFSQVFRDRGGMTGVVDYTNYDDMKYAIRKLDDSEFRNAFSRSYIRVEEYDSSRGYSRSPSYGLRQSYSRSPSRSPYVSRSRSRSRSRSFGGQGRRCIYAVAAFHHMWNIRTALRGLRHVPLQGADAPPFATGEHRRGRASTLADSSSFPDLFPSPASPPNSSFPARSRKTSNKVNLAGKLEFGGLAGDGKRSGKLLESAGVEARPRRSRTIGSSGGVLGVNVRNLTGSGVDACNSFGSAMAKEVGADFVTLQLVRLYKTAGKIMRCAKGHGAKDLVQDLDLQFVPLIIDLCEDRLQDRSVSR